MNRLGTKLLAYWKELGEAWEQERAVIEAATGWKTFNPIEDDDGWHELRLKLYPPTAGGLLVVGLNPGLYGMAQTGMPFTDQGVIAMRLPKLLKALLEAEKWGGERGQAPKELLELGVLNPSHNTENSSWPVYELLGRLYDSAEKGLKQGFLINPCPLVFVAPEQDETGSYNRTPEHVYSAVKATDSEVSPRSVSMRLYELRREWTRKAAEILKPKAVLFLGENNKDYLLPDLKKYYEESGAGEPVITAHTHPAIPPRTWAKEADQALSQVGYNPRHIRQAATVRNGGS